MLRIRLPKRLLSGALAAALTLTPAMAFTDTEGHWASATIDKWSQQYGVLLGYADGTFRPDDSITRGAFAGILDRFLRFQAVSGPQTFSDTAGTYWESSILKLNAAGVYLGNNGQALPGDTITRQQAVAMVARAFHIEPETTSLSYSDAEEISDYAKPYVAEMTAKGWLNDSQNGSFRPTEALTRAELVNILNNMVQVLLQKSGPYSNNIEGTLLVNASGGVELSHMQISGDLILAPGITGAVVLNNVNIGGSIRNFSQVEPVIKTPAAPEEPDNPEEPEEPEAPPVPDEPDQGIDVVPVTPADPIPIDPGTPVQPGTTAIQPSQVYTPGVTTGQYVEYSGKKIPVYAARPASRLYAGDFQWSGDRLVYTGNQFRTRFGIDVSSYQNRASANETIDWQAVRNDGVEFAMVRIGFRGYSNGTLNQDVFYRQNIQGAMNAGIETGVYFFAQAITVEEAIEEADYVIELLRDQRINGPVAYDWEMGTSSYRVYGTEPEMATACAVAFCKRIAEAGYTPMVYGGNYVSYLKYDMGALAPYIYWYPEYKSQSSEKLYPTLYYQVDYWQFTDSCSISGIGGRVDASLQFLP